MFRSLSIQIEKDVLADYLVADNAGNKEYCNIIVPTLTNSQKRRKYKMSLVKILTVSEEAESEELVYNF